MFSPCREHWAWPWAVLAPHAVPGLVQAEIVHRALLRHLCDLATISTATPISSNPFLTRRQQQWLFSLLPLLCHGHLIYFALWCVCKQSSVPCFADTFACDFQVPKSTRGGWQFTGLQLMLTLPPKFPTPESKGQWVENRQCREWGQRRLALSVAFSQASFCEWKAKASKQDKDEPLPHQNCSHELMTHNACHSIGSCPRNLGKKVLS